MFAVVTGASGHLGANLVRSLLAKKWKIKALVRRDKRAVDTHGQSPWHFVTQALLHALRAVTHSPTGKARGTLPFGFIGRT